MIEYSIVIDAATGDWTEVDTYTEPPEDKVLVGFYFEIFNIILHL